MYDREFQEGREALNGGIDRLLARIVRFWLAIGEAHARSAWNAPWRRIERRRRDGIA